MFQANDNAPEAASGTLHLADNLRDGVYPFTILRLGSANSPTVGLTSELGPDGKALWHMDNGRFRWQIAPHYHGGLVGWFDHGSDTNHLISRYPDPDAVFEGFKPWFGGIQPILRRNIEDWGDWPGKFYSETFTAEPIAVTAANGLHWQGVRVRTTPARHGFEGLHVTLDYLTLPHSNVLKLLFMVRNETAVVRTAVPALHAYLQVDGRYDNTVLHAEGQQRKRNKQEHWAWYGPWSAAENPDTGRTIMLVSASGRRRTCWLDWGDYGGHFYTEDEMQLPPHSQQTLAAYLVLANSMDEAQRYTEL
jgi:hypothetical protein